jgi:hypothetical protein
MIKDVIKLHQHSPSDWRSSWKEIENKWGDVDICGAGDPFNIDAKLNGAYIVIGLLYGDGDPLKTLEITTRCGQDSDCNPSNALAVLGVIKGFSKLPDNMRSGVEAIKDSIFINTSYSFSRAVTNTYNYAVKLVLENGGTIDGKNIMIKAQEPVPPKLEVSFPGVVFSKNISASDKKSWTTKGRWGSKFNTDEKVAEFRAIMGSKAGDEVELSFNGTGVSITGDWVKDGGKASVYLDGKLNRTIDTYYNFSNQEHTGVSIWHSFGLLPGDHTVRIIVSGEKRPESAGTNVYISGALIFKTDSRKSNNFKFSFE